MKPNKTNCTIGTAALVNDKLFLMCGKNSMPLPSVDLMGQPGNAFQPITSMAPGDQVEILTPTKLYQGINCIYIKHLSSGLNGYVYWTQFISSFTITAAGSAPSLTVKDKDVILASKKQKMPDPGYYVEYYVDANGSIVSVASMEEETMVICIGEGATAKSCRYKNDKQWNTLQWNCGPTRKQMEIQKLNKKPKGGRGESRYDYYPTWQDMIKNCSRLVSNVALKSKAPNDTFSP